MNYWIAATYVATDKEIDLQLGWLGLFIPVSAVAITAIVRAFTAESRVDKDCGTDVASVRDSVLAYCVSPVLASVVVRIHPYVNFENQVLEGEAGDPRIEAQRVLGANPTFADDYANLESQYAKIHRAQSVFDRRVSHAKRIGWAASTFLTTWLYFGFWFCMPSINFPVPMSVVALIIGSVAAGWIGAEALGSARESNSLTNLAREARRSGGSTR